MPKVDNLSYMFFFDSLSLTSDEWSVVASQFERILITANLVDVVGLALKSAMVPFEIIADFVTQTSEAVGMGQLHCLLSAESHLKAIGLEYIGNGYDRIIIPSRQRKDHGIHHALTMIGAGFSELSQDGALDFAMNPTDVVFTPNDATFEFLQLQRSFPDVLTVTASEGPQDFDSAFEDKGRLVKPNIMRNADVAALSGVATLYEIRPSFFSIVGLPKLDHQHIHKSQTKSGLVLLNLNFSFVNTKPAYESFGETWLKASERVLKSFGVDYIVSKHPRSYVESDPRNTIESNPEILQAQLEACDLVISRFSSILLEALSAGLEVIYFNPHGEPMPTFQYLSNLKFPTAHNEGDLRRLIQRFLMGEKLMSEEERQDLIRMHLHKDDKQSSTRILSLVSKIAESEPESGALDQLPLELVPEKETEALDILVLSSLPESSYSGGRYHAVALAHSLAASGGRVIISSDNFPAMHWDFRPNLNSDRVSYAVSKTYSAPLPVDFRPSVVICVPDLSGRPDVYDASIRLASLYGASLWMVNFETPNWFNSYSEKPRSPKLWAGAQKVAKRSDVILSSTIVGVPFAKVFYHDSHPHTRHVVAHPPINSAAIRKTLAAPKRFRIFFPTRLRGGEHKNSKVLLELISAKWSGNTLTVLSDLDFDSEFSREISKKCKTLGVNVDFRTSITDQEKFVILAESLVSVFPSSFEGFGYPVAEALAMGVPCLTYDLPVLKEVAGPYREVVPIGDVDALAGRLLEILDAPHSDEWRQEASAWALARYGLLEVGEKLAKYALTAPHPVATVDPLENPSSRSPKVATSLGLERFLVSSADRLRVPQTTRDLVKKLLGY